jgi:hypothetical protein
MIEIGGKMATKRELFSLVHKTLIASVVNVIILFSVSLFMSILSNWIILLLLGVFNGIIISIIIKNNITTILDIILAVIFTMIESIIIFLILLFIRTVIKPIDNLVIEIYKNVSFNQFIGHSIGIMIFIIMTLLTFIFSLFLAYTSKPK